MPGVDDRHREGVARKPELIGKPRADLRLLVHLVGDALGRLLLEVIVPIALAVVRIDGVVAHERLGECLPHRLSKDAPLQIRAHLPKRCLEGVEIIDPRDLLAAARAPLRCLPGAIPLDGAVDLPVGEGKSDLNVALLVGAHEELHLLAHGWHAVLEGERTAHLVALAEGGVEERLSALRDVRGPFLAVEEGVEAGIGVDVRGEPQPLLNRADAQSLRQGGLPIPGVPRGEERDAPSIQAADDLLGLGIVRRARADGRPQIEGESVAPRMLQWLRHLEDRLNQLCLCHAPAFLSVRAPCHRDGQGGAHDQNQ